MFRPNYSLKTHLRSFINLPSHSNPIIEQHHKKPFLTNRDHRTSNLDQQQPIEAQPPPQPPIPDPPSTSSIQPDEKSTETAFSFRMQVQVCRYAACGMSRVSAPKKDAATPTSASASLLPATRVSHSACEKKIREESRLMLGWNGSLV